MKAFLVGLLVLVLMGVLSIAGFLLIPILMVLGFFLRWVLGLFLMLFTIWLIGKVTLLALESMRRRDEQRSGGSQVPRGT